MARSFKSKSQSKPRPRGRPSIYSDALAESICARIAAGESVQAICGGKSKGMPSDATVTNWVINDVNGFFGKYMRAKQARCLRFADEIVEIADDGRNDAYIDDEGEARVDHDHIRRSALRIDTRKFLMVKYLPKVFGDRLDVEHGGRVELLALDKRIEEARARLRERKGEG